MEKKFQIIQSTTDNIVNRPPISWKVRDYFEDFILENVCKQKRIIVSSDWIIHLQCSFSPETPRYKEDFIHFFSKPRTVKENMVKVYQIWIPQILIDNAESKYERSFELMYEAISIFLINTYKKISKEFMNSLWGSVDKAYLLSLPYPAQVKDQRYLTDIFDKDGNIVDFVDVYRVKSGW